MRGAAPGTLRYAGTFGAAWTVFFVFLVAMLNYVDRQVLTILLQSIKRDLHLSDTQLGLLTGPAFAICFALAGLPLAFLAERRSRKLVILLSLAFWSICTAAIGAVQTFSQLLAARMLVAVGEAGSAPASQSMLGDLYPHGRRAGPMAIFSASVSVGLLIALMAGGLLDAAMGWRMAFVVVGLPGLALTLVLAVVLKEPRSSEPARPDRHPALLAGLRQLWAIRAYRGIVIGAAFHLVAASALSQWIAAYLMRAFSLGARDVGLPLGLLVGCIGGIATVAGGILADRLALRRPQWLAWLPAIAMVAGVPLALSVFWASSFQSALLLLVVPVIAVTAYTGPLLAAVQFLAPPGLRTLAAGLMMLVGGVFGQALGPLLVGFISDQLAPVAGAASLRWALAAAMPVSLLAAVFLWKAGSEMRDRRGDLAQASATGGT